MTDEKPQITHSSFLALRVCVPENWTDEQVIAFAEKENPCGTPVGWSIRKQGSERLKGMPERNPCDERKGFVHIMLDA